MKLPFLSGATALIAASLAFALPQTVEAKHHGHHQKGHHHRHWKGHARWHHHPHLHKHSKHRWHHKRCYYHHGRLFCRYYY